MLWEDRKMPEIDGHQIELSEGRSVFYAEHEGVHYFKFKNSEGTETKFKLSGDATEALINLLTAPKELSRWVLRLRDKAGSWEQVVDGALPSSDRGSQ